MSASYSLDSFVNHSNPTICNISAWINPRHGFVNFNCGGEMNETVGFYPRDDNRLDKYSKTFKTFKWGLANAVLLGVRCIEPPDYHQIIRWQSSLSAGSSAILSIKSMFILSSFSIAELNNDSMLLSQCREGKHPCLRAQLSVTPEIAAKAWNEYQSVKKALDLDAREICPLSPSDEIKYNPLSSNCIDFMRRIMDSTGISNWKQKMTYTSTPGILDKPFSLAWHYFNWT